MISSLSEAASACFFVLSLLFIYQKTPSVILLSNNILNYLSYFLTIVPCIFHAG
jgi:hypothetical protein